MPLARPKLLTSLTALALCTGALMPALAETQAPAAPGAGENSGKPRHFELSALFMSRPSLTREEIDPAAMQIGPQPAPNSVSKTASVPKVAPPIPTGAAAARRPMPPAPAVPGLATQPTDDGKGIDTGYLSEYNVDWSRWISTQADRWYYTLKFSEEMLGMRFVTQRAAMIQFTCYADGSIRNVILKQSSGVPAYDRLQMETLMATMPIQPFPRGTQRTAITLCQGWESHPRAAGETDFVPGTFGRDFPKERVQQWCAGR